MGHSTDEAACPAAEETAAVGLSAAIGDECVGVVAEASAPSSAYSTGSAGSVLGGADRTVCAAAGSDTKGRPSRAASSALKIWTMPSSEAIVPKTS